MSNRYGIDNLEQEYEYWFETEDGMASGHIMASSFQQAMERIADEHPYDKGADGYVVGQGGIEVPLEW